MGNCETPASKIRANVIDMTAYSRMRWRQKLKCLVNLAGLDDRAVGQIIGFSSDWVEDFFREEQAPFHADRAEEYQADLLLATLAYLLPIARYQPGRYRHLFTERNLLPSQEPPPWNTMGMRDYLVLGGVGALKEATDYISHRR